MKYENLRKSWNEEELRAFSGWDFSHLESRWHHEPTRWDYKEIVNETINPTCKLLDMGTGGGEFLLSLNHPYENTSVTEGWAPNIAMSKERLVPLGIKVYPVLDHSQLPIPDDSFDVVINRHETYDLSEVSRVLKPGGMFITQQVGGDNCVAFAGRLNRNNTLVYENFSLTTEIPKFEANYLSVKYADECCPELRFSDIGAVVFWAKIIEWTFPNFSVDNNFEQLCSLHDELLQKGFVSAIQHRFIVVAKNTK